MLLLGKHDAGETAYLQRREEEQAEAGGGETVSGQFHFYLSRRVPSACPSGYVRDDPKQRHIAMPAGGPAPLNAWKPHARCPPQPEVSLKALEPEAPPPTTTPPQVPQHGAPKLADQPPLLSAGRAPRIRRTFL